MLSGFLNFVCGHLVEHSIKMCRGNTFSLGNFVIKLPGLCDFMGTW
jgi:hypothetical protein